MPEEQLDDVTTSPRGLPEDAAPADSSPEISSEGLTWEPKQENSKSIMPAELAQSLNESGAIPTSARPKNAPPGEHIDGWSDSLVGWIPEESRIGAMPEEEAAASAAPERSTSSLVLVAVIAAVVVGGGGVAAVMMLSGEDTPPAVAASPKPPAPEPAAVAAPPLAPEAPPLSDHEPELVLDEDDLVLDDLEQEPESDAPAPAAPKAKKRPSRPARDVGEPASGPVVQLSASMVRREIAQNMFNIHRCYDTALKHNPDLEGRYSVTITIGTNGRVSHAVIDRDSLGHPGVAGCVKRTLMDWRFPIKGRLSEATEVSFPVTFKKQ